ncbi:MAG: hypothetical protein AB7K09_02075 [Planctomycetota bacterium]
MNDDPALARLHQAVAQIAEMNDADQEYADFEALYVSHTAGGWLHVRFLGLTFDEAFAACCAALCDPLVAPRLRTLQLDAIDEGANGTREWDFRPTVLASDAMFPALTRFQITRVQPGEHNRLIVAGNSYNEGGQLGQLLARMPAVRSFCAPSAPDATFFEQGERPLDELIIDVGYEPQGFLANLGASSCFPQLRRLEYGDFNERYMDGWQATCATFDQYAALLRAPGMQRVGKLVLRNSQLTPDEVARLKDVRADILIQLTQSWDTYA